MSVDCAYTRVAVRVLTKKHSMKNGKLQTETHTMVFDDFNKQFKGHTNFELEFATARKRFPVVNKVFNHKWNPSEAMQRYERAFSPSSWNALPMAEKQQHSLRDCKACKHLYGELPSYFPVKDTNAKSGTADENSVTIITGPDTTLKQVGKQILNKLSPIVQEQFDMTLQQVLVETPKSKHKRNSAQKLDDKRTILRQFRNQAQAEYDHVDEDLVMQHRMSFSQFDTMRKILGLKSTPSRKCKCKANSDTTPIPPKKRHGNQRIWALILIGYFKKQNSGEKTKVSTGLKKLDHMGSPN